MTYIQILNFLHLQNSVLQPAAAFTHMELTTNFKAAILQGKFNLDWQRKAKSFLLPLLF